jgi:aspartyl-tRNA(Asn)/glutamyl-tRNA(Gln) amidotransferase subunit A
MHQLMQQVELIAMPTTPISAVPIEQTTYLLNGSAHQVVSLLTRHTRLANLTGQPAASIPCGFTKTNLPIGLQLIGRPFEETIVLKVASAYESATDWHTRRPKLVRGSGRQLS